MWVIRQTQELSGGLLQLITDQDQFYPLNYRDCQLQKP